MTISIFILSILIFPLSIGLSIYKSIKHGLSSTKEGVDRVLDYIKYSFFLSAMIITSYLLNTLLLMVIFGDLPKSLNDLGDLPSGVALFGPIFFCINFALIYIGTIISSYRKKNPTVET